MKEKEMVGEYINKISILAINEYNHIKIMHSRKCNWREISHEKLSKERKSQLPLLFLILIAIRKFSFSKAFFTKNGLHKNLLRF